MHETYSMIKIGGLFSLLGGVAFIGVFTYLAINFNYPDILDGDAYQVLPQIVTGGDQMRAVWAIYALLPLILIPAALGYLHRNLRLRQLNNKRLLMLFSKD